MQTRPGEGADFSVFLPAGESGAETREPAALDPPGGGETILLVEDEPTVRSATLSVLEAHGYKVFPAPTGAAALDIWKKHRDMIDLLLTDLVMPGGLNGARTWHATSSPSGPIYGSFTRAATARR